MTEEWRPIRGFDGRYEVSDQGNVRSFCVIGSNARRIDKDNPAMMTQFDNGHGYKCVKIRVDGHVKGLYVHRLVAEAFIPNQQNLPCINHKDEDKANNCVDNLEWCTYKYNSNYGTVRQRHSENMKSWYKTHEARKGWHWSDEVKEKIRQAHLGKPGRSGWHWSEEGKEKLRQANTGKKASEETKRKLSERSRGEKNPAYGKNYYANKTEEEKRIIADKKRETWRIKREAKQQEEQKQ